MRFTNEDLDFQMSRMGMLKFYPSSPAMQAQIKALMAEMVPNKEALEWLVDQLVNRVNEWPGPAELRGLLCWKYSPADGITRDYCTIPGFTPADGEAKYIAREAERETKEISGESRKMLQLLASKKGFPEW